MMRRLLSLLLLLVALDAQAQAAPVAIEEIKNLAYKTGEAISDYERERCKLTLYLPREKSGFPTLVWLHGGGITAGSKDSKDTVAIARAFAGKGIAVAAVNYRLSPKVTFPAYVEDTAAAFAFVHAHIGEHGGEPAKVFLGGHSAGAYLSSIVAMDQRYLQKLGLDQTAIAGLIPVSGQMVTHFSVRKERGLPESTITADEAAPIYFSRKQTPPFLILFGDHDWPARLEENQYFVAFAKSLGNTRLELRVIPDRTHGSIGSKMQNPGDPAAKAAVEFIERVSAERQ